MTRRSQAVLIGLATSLLTLWTWGSLQEPPVVRDEVAYVLQAEIFADGKLHLPAPEDPEFFEQAHVIVEPVVASKYPPGHSLALIPGVWLGLPGLMPVLLTGLTGALLFLLAVRLTDRPAVGLVTCVLFIAWRGNLWWRLGYYSELTSTALWMVIWLLAMTWSDHRDHRKLTWIAVLTGLAAATRPLTALALAIPLGIFVLLRLVHEKELAKIVVPLLTGAVVLLLLPAWAYLTLGTVSELPVGLYTAQYMPWDRLGFGLEQTQPLRTLPPDLVHSLDYLPPHHARHSWAALPVVLLERVASFIHGAGPGLRWILLPLVGIGFWRWMKVNWLIPASVAALFIAYLSYAHAPWWWIYYAEVMPLLALISGHELHRIWLVINRKWPELRQWRHGLRSVGAGCAVVLIVWQVTVLKQLRQERTEPVKEVNEKLTALAERENVGVFLHYGSDYRSSLSFQRFPAHMRESPVLRAVDRGNANTKLVRQMPDRVWYRLDARDLSVCLFHNGESSRTLPQVKRCSEGGQDSSLSSDDRVDTDPRP